MMDRLTSMAVFVRAADLGSFAATAEALAMSPQMVAKHVAFLEARLGARLLARTTRRQSLTAIGSLYHEQCKLALAGVEEAERTTLDARSAPRGLLRINAPVTFGTYRVASFLSGFLRLFPEIEVDLVLNDRAIDLVDEGFEAVIRIGVLDETNLVARPLKPFRLIACAAPAYLEERGVPTDPADMPGHVALLYTRHNGRALADWTFERDGAVQVARVRGRLRINNASALLCAAVAGAGIAVVAEDMARDALRSGALREVFPGYRVPARPMHLLHAGDRRPTPKLRCFVEAVLAEFGQEEPG